MNNSAIAAELLEHGEVLCTTAAAAWCPWGTAQRICARPKWRKRQQAGHQQPACRCHGREESVHGEEGLKLVPAGAHIALSVLPLHVYPQTVILRKYPDNVSASTTSNSVVTGWGESSCGGGSRRGGVCPANFLGTCCVANVTRGIAILCNSGIETRRQNC